MADITQPNPLLTRRLIRGGAYEILEAEEKGKGLEVIKGILDDITDIVKDGIERERGR